MLLVGYMIIPINVAQWIIHGYVKQYLYVPLTWLRLQ